MIFGVWRDKKKLLNLRFSKLHSAKVLLKLEFDTKDQVLLAFKVNWTFAVQGLRVLKFQCLQA